MFRDSGFGVCRIYGVYGVLGLGFIGFRVWWFMVWGSGSGGPPKTSPKRSRCVVIIQSALDTVPTDIKEALNPKP